MDELQLRAPPTMLKLDIEGHEWEVLTSLVELGPGRATALLPPSISLELHYRTSVRSVSWYNRMRSPAEIGLWMEYMLTRGGYVLVDRHDNPMCRSCSEIVLARMGDVVAEAAALQLLRAGPGGD